MNKDQIFKFQENEVEVILTDDNQPLFNAKHVGICLGIDGSSIRKHCQKMTENQAIRFENGIGHKMLDVGTRSFHINGEWFLYEAGLYKVVLRSNKPEAEKFQDWVCGEVLPDIRKHGMYATPQTIDQMLKDPDKMIAILTKYKEEKEARIKAEREKVWIGNKREATAMATASKYKRRSDKAEKELGFHKDHASIMRVAKKLGCSERKFNFHKLKKSMEKFGLTIHKIDDPRFGWANVYHAKAWKDVYNIDLKELFA